MILWNFVIPRSGVAVWLPRSDGKVSRCGGQVDARKPLNEISFLLVSWSIEFLLVDFFSAGGSFTSTCLHDVSTSVNPLVFENQKKKREHLLPSECVVVKLPVVPSTSALLYDHNSAPSALDFNDFNGYTRYGSGWSSFKVARARRSCSSRFGSLKEKGGCMPCSWAACEVAPRGRVWSFLGFLLVGGNMSQQIKSVNNKNSNKRVVEC